MKNFGSERMKNGKKGGVGLVEVVEATFGRAPETQKGPAGNSHQWKMEENHCLRHAELPPQGMIRVAVLYNSLQRGQQHQEHLALYKDQIPPTYMAPLESQGYPQESPCSTRPLLYRLQLELVTTEGPGSVLQKRRCVGG